MEAADAARVLLKGASIKRIVSATGEAGSVRG
jgi:hypothetical protein